MNRSIVLLALVFCVVSLKAFGQEAADLSKQNHEATHAAIRQLRDGLIEAVNNKDLDKLTSLLHKDVILTAQDGEKLSTVRGVKEIRDYIDRLLVGPSAGVTKLVVHPKVAELTILHGDDAGIAYGDSSDDYTLRNGTQFVLNSRWSATVVKTDNDHWQLASLHISSNLFDNPVLNAQVKYATLVTVVAGVAGILIGCMGAKALRRKPSSSPS